MSLDKGPLTTFRCSVRTDKNWLDVCHLIYELLADVGKRSTFVNNLSGGRVFFSQGDSCVLFDTTINPSAVRLTDFERSVKYVNSVSPVSCLSGFMVPETVGLCTRLLCKGQIPQDLCVERDLFRTDALVILPRCWTGFSSPLTRKKKEGAGFTEGLSV